MEEVVAELQRERQRNAELLQKISALEARVMQLEREKASLAAPLMGNNNFQILINGQICVPIVK
ncbi:Transcriptional activator hacA [Bienertia sinuspersici]